MTFLGIIEHEFEMKMESGSSKKNRTLILVCITMDLLYKLFIVSSTRGIERGG